MTRRNNAMDCLRSCAILFVLASHAELALVGPTGTRHFGIGGTGVDLFFVLSGYLLGHQLCSELRATGSVDLRRFWVRRWMRTLPAYYAVLAATSIWLVIRHKAGLISPSYLVFLQNYLSDLPYYSVTWSLCVEEHFYLAIAPALLLGAWWPRTAWLVAGAFLGAPLACRILGAYRTMEETHVRWDTCAAGVLLAVIKVGRPGLWDKLSRWAPILATAGLIAFLQNAYARQFPSAVGTFADPLAWASIYASWVLLANSSPFWSSQFRVGGARYLAERSYAVYLLHPEVLSLMRRSPTMPYPVFFAATLLLSLGCAELLYRTIERPGNEAREKFRVSRSRSLPGAT